MRIHVTGVCGTGMGSLAGLLQSMGHEVSGSDVAFYPPMGPALRDWGVQLLEGFDAKNLDPSAHGGQKLDALVVGNVCRNDNPEALEAQRRGIERLHIADALRRWVLPGSAPLVVTGTHGKTTTSSLCAHLLEATGFEPGYLIGGLPRSSARSFHTAGKRRLSSSTSQAGVRATPFVLEGDEYDTAFWEKTPKFLHYQAQVAILTSVEHDHIDIYPTFDDYLSAFAKFVSSLPANGLLVAYAGDARGVELAQCAPCDVAYYCLGGENCHGVAPHWMAAPAQRNEEGVTFDLYAGGVLAGRFVSPLSGEHNLLNAVAALAACAQGYGAGLRSLAEPLAEFGGVRRRQELVGTPGGVALFDDFAHHPTAVDKTLAGLRPRNSEGRLIALFEPRSATACRKLHQAAYARAFESADVVLLAPVGRKLADEDKLDVTALAADLRSRNKVAEGPLRVPEMVERACELARPGDRIVALSNGDFGGILAQLQQALS